MSNNHGTTRNIVTIGASAGGLAPVQELLSQIPADLDASLFLVLHMPSRPAGHLVDILSASGPLTVNAQQDQLEQAMWVSMRMLVDRERVLERLAEDYRKKDRPQLAQSMTERANELAQEYQVLRNALAMLSAAETMVQGEALEAAG